MRHTDVMPPELWNRAIEKHYGLKPDSTMLTSITPEIKTYIDKMDADTIRELHECLTRAFDRRIHKWTENQARYNNNDATYSKRIEGTPLRVRISSGDICLEVVIKDGYTLGTRMQFKGVMPRTVLDSLKGKRLTEIMEYTDLVDMRRTIENAHTFVNAHTVLKLSDTPMSDYSYHEVFGSPEDRYRNVPNTLFGRKI